MFSNMNPLDKSTATWEILIMLLLAALLGYLLCRCWRNKCQKEVCTSPAGIVGATSNKKDDLQLIEGVGPAIEKVLNKNGVMTFAQVAELTESSIREMLDEAGPQFKIRTGETWAEQAELARDGKFDELDVLKEELIDGKRV
jgi:hypothetical protein